MAGQVGRHTARIVLKISVKMEGKLWWKRRREGGEWRERVVLIHYKRMQHTEACAHPPQRALHEQAHPLP